MRGGGSIPFEVRMASRFRISVTEVFTSEAISALLCSSCLYSDARSDFSRLTSDGSSRPDCDASLAARTRSPIRAEGVTFASGEAAVSSASVVRTDRSSWRCESVAASSSNDPWLLRRGGRTAAAAGCSLRAADASSGGRPVAGDASRERSGRLFTSRSHGAPVFVGAATCFPCTTSASGLPELPCAAAAVVVAAAAAAGRSLLKRSRPGTYAGWPGGGDAGLVGLPLPAAGGGASRDSKVLSFEVTPPPPPRARAADGGRPAAAVGGGACCASAADIAASQALSASAGEGAGAGAAAGAAHARSSAGAGAAAGAGAGASAAAGSSGGAEIGRGAEPSCSAVSGADFGRVRPGVPRAAAAATAGAAPLARIACIRWSASKPADAPSASDVAGDGVWRSRELERGTPAAAGAAAAAAARSRSILIISLRLGVPPAP